jgi:uncharacterized membrane protein YgcG
VVSAWRRREEPAGFVLAADPSRPLAWLAAPDPRTWEGAAATADRLLRFSAADRRGSRLIAREDGAAVAEFARRRLRGGGELDDGTRLRPVHAWRPRWRVLDDGALLATVVSLPRAEQRLTWEWEGDERLPALGLLFACHAILIDDLVTRRAMRFGRGGEGPREGGDFGGGGDGGGGGGDGGGG